MIRIEAMWLAAAPVDMRCGADRLLARVVQVFGAAQAHHGYLFANARGNQTTFSIPIIVCSDPVPMAPTSRQEGARCIGELAGGLRRGPARQPGGSLNVIDHCVTAHNASCQPFKWIATADSVLEKLHRLCSRMRGDLGFDAESPGFG